MIKMYSNQIRRQWQNTVWKIGIGKVATITCYLAQLENEVTEIWLHLNYNGYM
jgi:hypothetical protein